MKNTIAATKKFRNAVKKAGRVETKVAVLDSRKDIEDILEICDMIIDGDEGELLIERKFERLDTVVRDAFPLAIFDRDGYLVRN